MKIAVFGSAFNPPTLGHCDAIHAVLEDAANFDKVILVPSYQHAFGKTMLEYSHRTALLERFVSDIDNDRVQAYPIEHLIAKPGKPVYSVDVLSYLENTVFAGHQITFVMGPDNKANWHKFYRSDDIEARWGIKVVPERKAIRSTLVREAAKKGARLSAMVTPSVEDYINEHKLYA